MEKTLRIIKSRTVQVVALIVLVNVVDAFAGKLPPEVLAAFNGLAGLAATYFRVNPRQPFGSK